MDQLPDTTGLRNEIIIQRPHLTAYAHALRLAGAQLVEVGYLGFPGQGITWPWQVEAAITERTAALAWSVGSAQGIASLEEMVVIGQKHNLPVIVDAAASLPPAENLTRYIAAGASLVAYSGGKAIGGPQASGILVGRADLIESVALQHQDMDVYPATWTWRDRYLSTGRLPGPPHHGIGRPLKVGKEEVAGLIVALRRFLTRDHAAERQEQEQRLATIAAALEDIPGVEPDMLGNPRAPRSTPMLVVRIDETVVEQSVEQIVNSLAEGDPPVCVSQNFLHEDALGIVATTLRPGEEVTMVERLRAVLRDE
jgi:L-seryl-tRNA(Ser) seleniumtransferase